MRGNTPASDNDVEDQGARDERQWILGNRAAWTALLRQALHELGYEDTEATRAKWVLEREAAVAALRRVCDDWGDNDWTDNLYLADVIEKHLARQLGENAEDEA